MNYPTAMQEADPMVLFISMMWRTTVLYMYQLMKSVIHSTDEKRSILADYTRQSTIAAKEIVNLTNKLSQLNSFKVSPTISTAHISHMLTASARCILSHRYHFLYAQNFLFLITNWVTRIASSSRRSLKPCMV